MGMKSIRDYYGVPARRGGRVRFTPDGRSGVIVGSRGAYLRVRMDRDKQVGSYHPTWCLQYLAKGPDFGDARGEREPVVFRASR